MANWVRFADTKATILTAGLGVVITMLMTNAEIVIAGFAQGLAPAIVVGALATLTLLALLWTLWWLLQAIRPRGETEAPGLNRFAWPTLKAVSFDDLMEHVRAGSVTEDAWRQSISLAQLADKKFDACGRAVWGFGCLITLALAIVMTASAFTR